jgi:glycerol-3-phosphate dehydrogenase
MARRRPWDAVVVGGGVVGCAVLRELTVNLGWRVLLVEASPHLAAGASSGNTGIACTASDVAPGTLEHACLLEGAWLNLPTYRALNVPHRASGAMYVGHSEADLATLSLEQVVVVALLEFWWYY